MGALWSNGRRLGEDRGLIQLEKLVGPSLFREAAKIGSLRLVSGGMGPIFSILRHRALVSVPLDDTSVWMEQWSSSFGCFEKISFFFAGLTAGFSFIATIFLFGGAWNCSQE